MSLKSLKALFFAMLAVAAVAMPALAQAPVAAVTGHVTDATGLPLPGVTVTLQGVDIRQTFVTDAEGRYRFLDLAPGSYTMKSELPGFTTNLREHVIVVVGQDVDLPVKMGLELRSAKP